jgi:selenium-binding protein 1
MDRRRHPRDDARRGAKTMPMMTPDPTFYPSPAMATQSRPETLAYLALINGGGKTRPDALGVVDVDPASKSYGHLVGQTDMPHPGDELHHFGWNACSSCLCPWSPHPHMERRYLLVPGIQSSRIHVLDTKPNPREPRIVKVIEAETLAQRTGYAAPHTVHCGPDAIYMSALGAPDGNGPGGTFIIDPDTFDVRGRWELDRGPQMLAYDVWWHLGHDTMITSTWGTPNMVKNGVNPELLLGGKYGSTLNVWDLRRRRHLQEISLGSEQQMVLELRPAHDPRRAYGFAGVVISLKDLSSSIWVWYRESSGSNGHDTWAVKKVIEIPAEAADPSRLPPLLQGFKAAAPLVTDINLSVDDRYLYVSCWGTGEFIQYDVTDPFNPRRVSSLKLGGMVNRTAHPSRPRTPLNGGPQMVELSRDGRRAYLTNSLYTPWDNQFYPDGVRGWVAKIDIDPARGMTLDDRFFLETGDMRPHQVRLEGGDASSDSYCYA